MRAMYIRLGLFWGLLGPLSKRSRERRMHSYVKLLGVREGTSVLDLGGQPTIWDSVPFRLNITILNLPGAAETMRETHHNIRYVEGDACHVEQFKDRSFEVVFSNSVIEHVGPPEKQASFAREVRRLGRSYWVQTPSKWFPIEAHCGMPLWWFYPAKLRQYFIERWRRINPPWTEMVEGTTVLSKSDLMRLFPEASVVVETLFGIPKSNIAYFRAPNDGAFNPS